MSYITSEDLKGLIPPDWLAQALDDDDDGIEDLNRWQSISDAAHDAVNGSLSTSYGVPIAEPSLYPFLKHVTRYEAARVCYARRGFTKDGFPHQDMWEKAWSQLTKIGEGKLPLGSQGGGETPRNKPRGATIVSPAKTYSSGGRSAI